MITLTNTTLVVIIDDSDAYLGDPFWLSSSMTSSPPMISTTLPHSSTFHLLYSPFQASHFLTTPSILVFSFNTLFQSFDPNKIHNFWTYYHFTVPHLSHVSLPFSISLNSTLIFKLHKSPYPSLCDSPLAKPILVKNSLPVLCLFSATEWSWRTTYHHADCAHFTMMDTNLKGSLKAAWQSYSTFLGHSLSQLCLNTISSLLPLSSNFQHLLPIYFEKMTLLPIPLRKRQSKDKFHRLSPPYLCSYQHLHLYAQPSPLF